jgi:hypothetical protein
VDSFAAAIAVMLGELVMLWMFFSGLLKLKPPYGSPLQANMTLVVGTATIFVVAIGLTFLRTAFASRSA